MVLAQRSLDERPYHTTHPLAINLLFCKIFRKERARADEACPCAWNKQASKVREAEIIRMVERGEAGIADSVSHQSKKPLENHLQAFEAHLEGKGNTRDHIDKTLSRCHRIAEEIAAQRFADVTSEAVETCLADWRRGGMSVGTSNGYFRAIRTFCKWMVRSKRVQQNPLAGRG